MRHTAHPPSPLPPSRYAAEHAPALLVQAAAYNNVVPHAANKPTPPPRRFPGASDVLGMQRGLGFGVWGLGFRVWGLGIRLEGLCFQLEVLGFGV